MPRRHIPPHSVPPRHDHSRSGGNATGAQRRPGARRGQLEAIAERRVRALELRKAGAPYRQIARELGVDTHTAWADVAAELAGLRETTVTEATELRALELERLDAMNAGLWPQIRTGSPPAVTAGVRICERRSRLLGLDAPTTSKTEVTASRSVTDAQLKAQAQELSYLDIDELEELARASEQLITDALARVRARRLGMSVAVPALPTPADAATVTPSESPVVGETRAGDGESLAGASVCKSGDAETPTEDDADSGSREDGDSPAAE